MFTKVVSSRSRRFNHKPQVRADDQRSSDLRCEAELPPILCRWSDFNDPFPKVSLGGYLKYYLTYGHPDCPLVTGPSLSTTPEPSPACETPPLSPLFLASSSESSVSSTLSTPPPLSPERGLGVIHETSLESILSRSERLSHTPTRPLRRRRRRVVLRTASIERDLALAHQSKTSPHHPTSFSTESPVSHASSYDSDSSHTSRSTGTRPLSFESCTSHSDLFEALSNTIGVDVEIETKPEKVGDATDLLGRPESRPLYGESR